MFRLPGTVPVMALEEVMQAAKVVMQQVMREIARFALQEHVLVDLVISRLKPAGLKSFVTTKPVLEQAKVPTRVPAVLEPAPQEKHPSIDVKAGARTRAGKSSVIAAVRCLCEIEMGASPPWLRGVYVLASERSGVSIQDRS